MEKFGELSGDEDHEPATVPLEELLQREQESQLLEAIETLTVPQRSAILLHFLEGFSVEEIAGITKVPAGTVKSRLFHARTRLKQKLTLLLHHENTP